MTTGKDGSPKTLAEALVSLRGELANPARDAKNPYYGSKYAKLEGIIKEIRQLLFDNNLTFIQNIVSENNTIMAQTIFIHASGEERTIDGPRVVLEKFTPQTVGAVTTYAKRYSLLAALGVEPDEDDDANSAEDDFDDLDISQHPSERNETEPVVIGKSFGGIAIETEEHAVMFLNAFEMHCDAQASTKAELKAIKDKSNPDIQDCRMLFPEVGDKITAYIQKKVKSLSA